MDAPRKTELSERIREELKQLKEDSHSASFDLNKSVTLNVEVRDWLLDNLAYMATTGSHFRNAGNIRDPSPTIHLEAHSVE